MSEKLWAEVDDYFNSLLLPPDPALEVALEASKAAGLPSIAVAPNQGRLLMLLAKMRGARAILEIGTLGGYSTIWLARGLAPGGRLISLEANAKHAEVARKNLARAGFAAVAEVRVGAALAALARLEAEGAGPFDFIFIDADKPNTPDYFSWALKLARRGAVIVADNVVRDGAVVDADSRSADVKGIRRFFALAAAESRVEATAIQTVGAKGYDGLAIALVVAD
jgi:predicted O-methyltransferase YrrM